jgi:hypothetical protein
MTATAIPSMPIEDVKQPISTATPIQQVTTEDVKLAILALIRENNAEFKAFLDNTSSKIADKLTPKKGKRKSSKSKEMSITFVESEHVPYTEMPYWKANPHLKPLDGNKYAIKLEDLKALQTFFQEPGNEITDEWFEMLD